MFLLVCGIHILLLTLPVLCNNCDNYGVLLYEDLGCIPEYGKESGKDNGCPIKYNCGDLKPSNNTCLFKGKLYQNGESVDNDLSSASCNAGCLCRADGPNSGFICAILDCPEWLGISITPGCYRKYSLNSCCSTGQVCPPFVDIEKCVVEGKENSEGEKFYPAGTCLSCVCEKGFQGKFVEPFCKRRSCGQQLRHFNEIKSSCAPFYSQQIHEKVLCCPDDWICPDGSESPKGEIKSDEVCKYGDKTLKVGQYIERSNITDAFGRHFEKVTCDCEIPPFLKCINDS